MTRREAEATPLGQTLVYWLWSVVLFGSGLASTLNAAPPVFNLVREAVRVILVSVGFAAVVICTLELGWKLRSLNRPTT